MTWLLLLAGLASAQSADDPLNPEMTAQLWRPTVDARTSMWTDDTSWAPGTWFMGRMAMSYMSSPIQYEYDNGDTVNVLGNAVQGNLVLGAAFGRARIGLDVPLHLYADGDAVPAGTFGLGDVGLDLKINALDRGRWPVGLAFAARGVAPSASVPAPLSDPRAHAELSVIVDRREGNVLLAANVGARVMAQPGEFTTEWLARPFVRMSAGYMVTDGSGLSLDLVSYAPQKLPYPTGVHGETMVGAWVRLGESLVLRGGVGTGIGRGVGTPTMRGVASLGFEPPRERDQDMDGIMDRLDECPFEVEDRDRFEDWDGCLDADNDEDGIPDKRDFCALEPEDIDGFEDGDGCPESPVEGVFRVVDNVGQPIEGARITVSGPGIEPSWGGAEHFVILEPGSYTMSAKADGYAPVETTVVVEEGRSVSVVRKMELSNPTGFAEGTAKAEGRELKGVQIAPRGSAFQALGEGVELVAGPYRLAVRAPGFGVVETDVRVAPDGVAKFEVELVPARATVTAKGIALSSPPVFTDERLGLAVGAQLALDDLAGVLLDDTNLSIVIVGQGEGDGATGGVLLGEKRALAVKRYLAARGVPGTRIAIRGEAVSSVSDVDIITVELAAKSAD